LLPRFHRAAAIATLFGLCGLLAAAEEPKPAPKVSSPISLEVIRVEPGSPAPDTLCHLAVTLKNAGERTASRFELRVKVGGSDLPSYHGRVFLARLPPHYALELPLFNFWSSESKRPPPAAGKLEIEVTLIDARWVELESAGGVETWKPTLPAAAIEGLPLTKTLTLPLAKPR
jgi:hypothetical protein